MSRYEPGSEARDTVSDQRGSAAERPELRLANGGPGITAQEDVASEFYAFYPGSPDGALLLPEGSGEQPEAQPETPPQTTAGEASANPLPGISWLSRTALEQSRKPWHHPAVAGKLHGFAVREGLEAVRGHVAEPLNAEIVVLSLYDVAAKLHPHLAEYDLVIGDDVSGRLPALIYRQLINTRRKELGLPKAVTHFINGRRYSPYPPPLPPASDPAARALIVTEWVGSGFAVNNLYSEVGLVRNNSTVDVAAVGHSGEEELILQAESRYVVPPVVVSGENILNHLYHKGSSLAAGVQKVVNMYAPNTSRLPPSLFSGVLVRAVRQDVRTLADTLYALLPPINR